MPNNLSRMLIALLVAIIAHWGLLGFKFQAKPFSVPSVSLPRSVSVFLGQKKEVDSIQKIHETQPVNQFEKSPQLPAPQTETVNKIELKKILQPAVKAVQPVDIPKKKDEAKVEDILSGTQLSEKTAETEKIGEASVRTESQTVSEENGTSQPGTLQMAYPHYRLNTPPHYPSLARKRGQKGTVILQVLINREGGVAELKIDVSSGFSLLDRAAEKAVRKWSFEPGRKGSERIPMWVKVPVTFKLK
jgi:protein TonB